MSELGLRLYILEHSWTYLYWDTESTEDIHI